MGILDRLISMLGGNDDASESDSTSSEPAQSHRAWANQSGGYMVCSHFGCTKKVDWQILNHDCCGRCSQGRTCRTKVADDYAGPGTFAHKYFETMFSPGLCDVCGEPPEEH